MEVLKPLLLGKLQTSWVDPSGDKDRERILDDYLIAWGAAQAAQEILDLEKIMESKHEGLVIKSEGKEVDNFRIGA